MTWPSYENATLKFDLRPLLKCSSLEVQHPPPSDVKIGAFLRFRGNRDLVNQWVAYHRLIGIDYFWIYVNEEFDNATGLYEWDNVRYVPYRYVWSAEHWDYAHGFKAAYGGDDFWKTSASQQCLYLAKRYGLDWLLVADSDEYLWISQPNATKIHDVVRPFTNRSDIVGLLLNNIPYGGKWRADEQRWDALHGTDRDGRDHLGPGPSL